MREGKGDPDAGRRRKQGEKDADGGGKETILSQMPEERKGEGEGEKNLTLTLTLALTLTLVPECPTPLR